MKKFLGLLIAACLLVACAPAATPTPEKIVETVVVKETVEVPVEKTVVVEVPVVVTPSPMVIKVHGIFATELTEPWDQAIHRPLDKLAKDGLIEYRYSEALGYAGDLEREVRRVIEERHPDLIIGDAFGNEEAVRRVASENPEIAFAFGSAGGPVSPNFSVFDNWNIDGSFVAGQIAASLSKTGIVGEVLGVDCAEVNRLGWAFVEGARSVNPDVVVLASYIDDWYDPPKAEEHAWAKIEAGADVLYCERVGCEQAAVKASGKVWVIGQMVDQSSLAPENTVTSVVWDMTETVESAITQVQAGTWKAQDLGPMSFMAVKGTYLAPIQENIKSQLSAELLAFIAKEVNEIMAGRRTPIIEDTLPARIE